MEFCEVLLTEAVIQVPAPPRLPDSGACLDFLGTVRGIENGRRLSGIDYEFHPLLASVELGRLAEEASAQFSLIGCALIHRTGFVAVGEASVFVRVLTGHRPEAYEASRWILEQLKIRVPIWKKPVFA